MEMRTYALSEMASSSSSSSSSAEAGEALADRWVSNQAKVNKEKRVYALMAPAAAEGPRPILLGLFFILDQFAGHLVSKQA